ncbi:MAG: tetratricopeptide repeat protein, partial [bacterium]|nr:tetratricopeptide repeat protein [bacterium]
KKVVNGSPDDAAAHYHLGVSFYNKNMIKDAIQEFTTAVKLNPMDLTSKRNLDMLKSLKIQE